MLTCCDLWTKLNSRLVYCLQLYGIPPNLKIYISCSIFQEDYGIDGCSSEDRRSWTTKMIDFCKSCIDPTRPMGEDASSEGYATPRSLETPVQMASKCPSLNQIRDPYASRCEIFGFLSPLVPSKREKNVLVLLSLYIF